MAHEPRRGVDPWWTLAVALDGGTAALAGSTALTLGRVAARRTLPRGRRVGAAALAWLAAAVAAERSFSLALFLSYSFAGPVDLFFGPALRLLVHLPLFGAAAVLAGLVSRRRR